MNELKSFIESMSSSYINIIVGVLILFFGFLILRTFRKIIKNKIVKAEIEITGRIFLVDLIYTITIIILLLTSLSIMGVPLAPILTFLGVIGIGLSMSLRTSVGNLMSGLLLIIYRPFQVGDYIDIGGIKGEFDSLGMISSTLKLSNSDIIVIPNNNLLSKNITKIKESNSFSFEFKIETLLECDIELLSKHITNQYEQLNNISSVKVDIINVCINSMTIAIKITAKKDNKSELLKIFREILINNKQYLKV